MKDFIYLVEGLESTRPGEAYLELLNIIDPTLKDNIDNFGYLTRQLKDGYYPNYNEFLKVFGSIK
jgi:hypothetical protein